MSNTRRATGVPAALARDGVAVPPSADVAERNLAEVIGEAVALHLAPLLRPPARPACIVCAAKVKRAEKAHAIALANARAAAEEEPAPPDLGVTESFTDGNRGPVCWGCFDPDKDAVPDIDMTDYLPPATD